MIGVLISLPLIFVLFILCGSFFAFISGAFPRKVRCLKKSFALYPSIVGDKWVWGKYYFSYHTYGHGMVLGGTVKSHYSEDGKYVSYSTRSASFFPHSEMEWSGISIFSLRSYLRQDPLYKNKYQKTLESINNLENINNIFYDGNNYEIKQKIKKLKKRRQ